MNLAVPSYFSSGREDAFLMENFSVCLHFTYSRQQLASQCIIWQMCVRFFVFISFGTWHIASRHIFLASLFFAMELTIQQMKQFRMRLDKSFRLGNLLSLGNSIKASHKDESLFAVIRISRQYRPSNQFCYQLFLDCAYVEEFLPESFFPQFPVSPL